MNAFFSKYSAKLIIVFAILVWSVVAYAQVTLNLNPGWNLLGNSSAAPIDVASTFGDASKIVSIWKWNKTASKWAFYTPSVTSTALTSYAQSKGYDVLTSLDAKDGFWVNASSAAIVTGPTTNGVVLVSSDLIQGWNLASSADLKTPSQLTHGLSNSLSAADKEIVTIWAWDTHNINWKFYAPTLEIQGGNALADYIASKGFLPFSTALFPSDGFWLNVGTATASASASFTGTGAIGVTLGGASVTVTDSTGATVAVTTTADDGSYNTGIFNPNNFVPPFVISLHGNVGNSDETLVSLYTIPPTPGTVVNVTPITNAIASGLSSTGNPIDLVTNLGTESASITSTSVAVAELAYRAVLAANMTSVGIDAQNFNLISGTFDLKLDKLLDNVKINVSSTGVINISTNAGTAISDLGDFATPPAVPKLLTLAKGVLPSAGDASSLPAPTGESVPIGTNVMEPIRQAFNDCFALPTVQRNIFSGACSTLVIPTGYLNAGRTSSEEFSSGLGRTLDFADAGNDGMTFGAAEILRQIDTAPNREKIIVRFSGLRLNRSFGELITVAENNSTPGAGWQLVGDQRQFDTWVNATGFYVQLPNLPQSSSRFDSGIGMNIRDNSSISKVVVTGPGLPGYVSSTNQGTGVKFVRKSGCTFLTIEVPGSAGCFSVFKLALFYVSGSIVPTSTSPVVAGPFTSTAQAESLIASIKPLDVYRFEITKTDNSVVTYWNRLRGKPPSYTELAAMKWPAFAPSTVALMTNSTIYHGGVAPSISWTIPDGAARPFNTNFAHGAGTDNMRVPFSQTSIVFSCSGNADCSGQNYVSSIPASLQTSTAQYQFELISRDRFDVILVTQLKK